MIWPASPQTTLRLPARRRPGHAAAVRPRPAGPPIAAEQGETLSATTYEISATAPPGSLGWVSGTAWPPVRPDPTASRSWSVWPRSPRSCEPLVGNRAVLDLLIELTEVAHVWRLARARMEQLLAARATLELAKARAIRGARQAHLLPLLDRSGRPAAGRTLPCSTVCSGTPTAPIERRLCSPSGCSTRRSVLDHYPQPLPPTQNLAALLPVLHSPDRERDLEEESPVRGPRSTLDAIVTAVFGSGTPRSRTTPTSPSVAIPTVGPARSSLQRCRPSPIDET